MYPCYGMAETVVATTLPQRGTFPNRRYGFISCDQINSDVLQREAHAEPIVAGDTTGASTIDVLGMGQPVAGLDVCIQDIDGHVLPERHVGEICVRGISLMTGYFRDPEATARAVRDGWYHTGDRGYLADGELYVLGRIKELIIVRGRNYQPHDIEATIETHPAVRKSYAVAFGVYNDEQGTDEVVGVAETNAATEAWPTIIQEIQTALQSAFGFTAREILLVRHGTLPRTTSGKPQRLLTSERYRTGMLNQPIAEDTADQR